MRCTIARRDVFSRSYKNAEALGFGQATIDWVAAQLERQFPEVSWNPDAGEIAVEADSLREARAAHDADSIAEFMERCWEQAMRETLPEPPEFGEIMRLASFFGSASTLKSVERQFGIPYRTLQDWNSGRRPCPAYIRRMLMMAWRWF